MNDQMNAPMSREPAGISSWFSTWKDALTKPNEQTFAAMANSGKAKASTAYAWVFVASLVQIFLSALVQSAMMRNLMEQYGGGGSFDSGGIGTRLIGAICGAPIGAVIVTLFFAIGVFIVQWVAKMFGGTGTADQLAFTLGSITAPYSIIAGVLTLLAAIPYVGLCFSLVLGIAGIYVFVLQVMAVKGVNQFGWGAAIGSLLLPSLVIGLVCGCLFAIGGIGLMRLLGPAIGNTFSSINASLP